MKTAFEDGAHLREFLVQVKRVVEWLHEHGEKHGLRTKVNDGTVSRALRGEQFDEDLATALDALHAEAMRDPWAWCGPPAQIEDLTGLPWWHETLQPDVPLNTWNLMRKRPLSEERRAKVQELLDDYRDKLRAVCDQHAFDARLMQAWAADMRHPGYDEWVMVDGKPFRLGGPYYSVQGDAWKTRRTPEGMHTVLRDMAHEGATSEQMVDAAARACALQDVAMSLPDIRLCRLTYEVEPADDDYEAARAIVDEAILSKFVDALPGKFNGDSWEVEVFHPDHPKKLVPSEIERDGKLVKMTRLVLDPDVPADLFRFTWDGTQYSREALRTFRDFQEPPKSEWELHEEGLDRQAAEWRRKRDEIITASRLKHPPD